MVEYNPEWENEFQKIEDELLFVLAGKILSIEHVGSTSVRGLAAKPIIDIDIVIDDNFDEVKSLLESMGYHHEGDLGIPGRDAFKYEWKPHLMMHHLYVCKKDNEELARHLTFRNYLREHPDVRDRYGAVKKEMALRYFDDRDSYMIGKSSIIEEIYWMCGFIR
ncbi:GrpB family protein [uncultured Methanocorpusculum sp.]|nr:GrpB family protein [uncultured Methanocorpusculum sp.]